MVWRRPNADEEHGAGPDIISRRVKVDGVGEGVVIAFKKKKYGASPHTIRLDASGDEVNIKLDRKWNGKTPWEIEDYAIGQPYLH